MNKLILIAGAMAGLAATPLSAQQATYGAPRAPLYQITPYAGYMVFGKMFEGPVGTSLSTKNAPIYGAQLGVNLTPSIALVGNVGYANGDMQVGIPFLGGLSVGTSKAWLYDGGIQLSLPSSVGGMLPIRPFVQLGAGVTSYDVETGPLDVKATNFAGNAGVGADLSLGRNLGLRLMAKDYIGKFDVKEATQLDFEGKLSHNFGLSAGLSLSF